MRLTERFAIAGLLFLSISLFAYPTAPPQPLHLVGDHWTPYNPPQEIPEGIEVYTIQPGDTLWTLAEEKLGNPFLWPQIWENNTYIEDAHWIYPGDPLIMSAQPVEEVPQETYTQVEQPVQEPETASPLIQEVGGKRITKPVPLGSLSDMECFYKVLPVDQDFPLTIKGTDEGKIHFTLTEGHIAYIVGGTAEGVQAGDIYFIAEDKGVIEEEGVQLGRAWMLYGKLSVLCAQEHAATARITMACDSILRGYNLIPYELVPIPTNIPSKFAAPCASPTEKVRGKILLARDDSYSMGQGYNVVISVGKADGLEAGQYLRIFRDLPAEGSDYVLCGRMAVLEAFDHTANCRIVDSLREIHIGDRVELE